MKTELSDKHLIEAFLIGDKSSLQILVQRWHKIFCEKAYWVLHDKDLAKDVAQDCWVLIINKMHTLKNPESFRSWALRIIYTKAIDEHKKRIKEIQSLKNMNKAELDSPLVNNENEDLKKKLRIAIQELSKDQQDIVRLFYLERYSLIEISSFLQIPVGTVKSRLFKAREKLKSIIK